MVLCDCPGAPLRSVFPNIRWTNTGQYWRALEAGTGTEVGRKLKMILSFSIEMGSLEEFLDHWSAQYPDSYDPTKYYPYCSPSAPLRQIEGLHEGRISGSS